MVRFEGGVKEWAMLDVADMFAFSSGISNTLKYILFSLSCYNIHFPFRYVLTASGSSFSNT
jgi:hypothetical protein